MESLHYKHVHKGRKHPDFIRYKLYLYKSKELLFGKMYTRDHVMIHELTPWGYEDQWISIVFYNSYAETEPLFVYMTSFRRIRERFEEIKREQTRNLQPKLYIYLRRCQHCHFSVPKRVFASTVAARSFVVYFEHEDPEQMIVEDVSAYQVFISKTDIPTTNTLLANIVKNETVAFERRTTHKDLTAYEAFDLEPETTYVVGVKYCNPSKAKCGDLSKLITVKTTKEKLEKRPQVSKLSIVTPYRIGVEWTGIADIANVSLLHNGEVIRGVSLNKEVTYYFEDLSPSMLYTITAREVFEDDRSFPLIVKLRTPNVQTEHNTEQRAITSQIADLSKQIEEVQKRVAEKKTILARRKRELAEQIANANNRIAAVRAKEEALASRSEFMKNMLFTPKTFFLGILVLQFGIVVGMVVFVTAQYCVLHSLRKKSRRNL
ncbi:hypothetical protein RB195_001281 [Necator americanus]|uniref:Fibronectin type III domain protein n=1 Tax=Necator americanus TaxID=51031 RepID=A0ABR1DGI2_NECAM